MPRTRNEQRHKELGEAALATILDKGIANFTLADISARADVRRSLLYWYFPEGVEDALKAASRVAIERRDQALARSADETQHPIERLDGWLSAALQHAAASPGHAVLVAAEGGAMMSEHTDCAALVDALATGLLDGRVASCEPGDVVALVAAVADAASFAPDPNTAASVRGVRAMLASLHTGDWQPQPHWPPADEDNCDNMSSAASSSDTALKQVVRPRGTWLELD